MEGLIWGYCTLYFLLCTVLHISARVAYLGILELGSRSEFYTPSPTTFGKLVHRVLSK